MDLAVRRRFAFMTLMPARQVLVDQNCPEAALRRVRLADRRLRRVRAGRSPHSHAGHSYFIAKTDDELRTRFRYELLPLIDEYLRQGFLAQATSELISVRDRIDDMSRES